MAFSQFDSIESTDFNNLVGTSPGTTANQLNTVWAVGGGQSGYGQTAIAQTSPGQTVASVGQWGNLVTATASAAAHQGSSITSVSTPVAGGTISFVSAIPTNLTTIFANRLNAATQGSTTANTTTTGTTWSNVATWTHTATFANSEAVRYFFNAGGQLTLTMSHPNGTGIDLLLNNLASNIGTVALSAPTSGTISIAGTSYSGVTKIGGGGNSPTISQNNGYYALTTSNANVFSQTASTGPSGYLGTNISVLVRSNGTQGANADRGTVITIHTIWDQIPNGLVVASGSQVTLTARAPSTTNIANAWGTITLAGSVVVS